MCQSPQGSSGFNPGMQMQTKPLQMQYQPPGGMESRYGGYQPRGGQDPMERFRQPQFMPKPFQVPQQPMQGLRPGNGVDGYGISTGPTELQTGGIEQMPQGWGRGGPIQPFQTGGPEPLPPHMQLGYGPAQPREQFPVDPMVAQRPRGFGVGLLRQPTPQQMVGPQALMQQYMRGR